MPISPRVRLPPARTESHQHSTHRGPKGSQIPSRLLPVSGSDQRVVDVDAELARIDRIERVFSSRRRRCRPSSVPPHRVQPSCLPRIPALYFKHTSLGRPHTQRDIEPERTDKIGLDIHERRSCPASSPKPCERVDWEERGQQEPWSYHGAFLSDRLRQGKSERH